MYLHFPWSGSVAQRIEPDTRWFFQGINPSAGDPEIEEKIAEHADIKSAEAYAARAADIAAQVAELRRKGGKLLPLLRDDH